jgi:hypothetical protein
MITWRLVNLQREERIGREHARQLSGKMGEELGPIYRTLGKGRG